MTKSNHFVKTILILTLLGTSSLAIAQGNKKSEAPIFWTFAAPPPGGSSTIVRTPGGIQANLKTTGLIAGHAVTLWIMFYNAPENCDQPNACVDTDVGNPATQFDFHYAGGHVVNGNKTTLVGHLRTNDTSGSGWAEMAAIGAQVPPPVALTNPMGAQVILAVHSHGPSQRGQDLAAQISSYLGGCVLPFLGNNAGFAQSASDIPALEGDCSTIQVSPHP